jgi:short-subunit dehydrogenase
MPTALITGGSNGIGFEFSRIFAREGYGLVLVARDEVRLRKAAAELKPAPVEIIAADLAAPSTPFDIFRQVPRTDVLVNNAGFTVFGKFTEKPVEDQLSMMQVNMGALVALTGLYLPGMVAAKSGRILNVASTAAFQPGPLMAVYYATKAFVLSFSEAISNELQGTGVTVTALCPGPTESGFQERGKMEDSGLFKNSKVMDARTVAEAGYRGLMEGRTLVIPGLKNRLLASSVRFMPRSIVPGLVRRMQEKVE